MFQKPGINHCVDIVKTFFEAVHNRLFQANYPLPLQASSNFSDEIINSSAYLC